MLRTPRRPGPLSFPELVARARRVRVVLADSEGVLTDGTVYVSEIAESMKRYSLRDGIGVVRLREAGIETASVAREGAHLAARSAGTVRAPIFERLLDEAAELPGIPAGCTADEVAYIGSDVSDLGIIEEVGRSGLTAAPFAAPAPVAAAVHHVCRARGGDGAFQEFAEWLLGLREAGTRIGRGEPVSRPS